MKIMKRTMFLTILCLFTLISINVQAEDCSDYKLLSHKWNKCMTIGKVTGIGGGSDKATKTKKDKKSGGLLSNTLNKIKTLGGETVGAGD